MAALIGLFAGALAGHLLWRDWGAALGGIAGFIIGAKLGALRASAARRAPSSAAGSSRAGPTGDRGEGELPSRERTLLQRIADLEQRVASLERAGASVATPEAAPRSSAIPGTALGSAAIPAVAPGPSEMPAVAPESYEMPAVEPGSPRVPAIEGTAPVDERGPTTSAMPAIEGTVRGDERGPTTAAMPVSPKAGAVWTWFTGGNALTRIGVVVLFFGVAFLLRYFAEHFSFPIGLRLAVVAAGGFLLIGIGARLAASRPGYGLSLQGAGAGILYLTTYAAFRLYGVLPELPTIALLVAVSVATVWLAMRNDSQPLAGLAIAGGFLAPMLVAEGGEPVHLFGYFALLNGAIFALAWARAWRGLNAVGFVFTFVLGAYWGHGFYRPEHYTVVQPFLILFFVFYVTIAVLYARRGPLAAKDPVDGLLVFGVPLVGFALQAAIVGDVRYGAAWSALALTAVYGLLFVALRRREAPGFALLSRAFLALAAVFATLAIPLALDHRTTAALWAVEAAGVYWIGVRQRARLARAFALVIELGAGIAFAFSGIGGEGDPLFANAFFLGALLIAVSGIVTARIADGAGDALTGGERSLVPLVFAWGALWWLAAGGIELDRQLPDAEGLHAILAWVTASVAAALALSRLRSWPRLAAAGVALLPAMALAALGDFERARTTLTFYGWLVWPCAWLVHWRALRHADAGTTTGAAVEPGALAVERPLRIVHTVSALMLVTQVAWEASEWTGRATAPDTVWTPCAAALPAVAFLWLCVRFRDSALWPLAPHRDAYALGAGRWIAGLLTAWFVMVNGLSPGDPSPLPYFPVANPLDLTLAFALWALFAWARCFGGMSEPALYRWLGAGLFVALNGIVLRTAHQWADIPWRWSALLASKPLQAALTLTWTATALAAMVVATRRGIRPLWMLGAALLAVVVGKLFIVDLGALSGLPRVVAFMGVGLLLLVIGFLSPLPPAAREEDRGEDASPRA